MVLSYFSAEIKCKCSFVMNYNASKFVPCYLMSVLKVFPKIIRYLYLIIQDALFIMTDNASGLDPIFCDHWICGLSGPSVWRRSHHFFNGINNEG